jgi:hypothetical protein
MSGHMVDTSGLLFGGGWMPWMETNPVLERRHFVHDYESGHWNMTEHWAPVALRYCTEQLVWSRSQAAFLRRYLWR